MNQKGFIKDVVIVILGVVILIGGYFYFFKKPANAPAEKFNQNQTTTINQEKITDTGDKTGTGFIEGSLSYPSDFIPPMKICAEDINTKKQYCTSENIKSSRYKYGEGYKISVPSGQYYVFATTEALGSYRAYHSEAKCGEAGGKSHDPILVEVRSGRDIDNINPCDWYK